MHVGSCTHAYTHIHKLRYTDDISASYKYAKARASKVRFFYAQH